MRVHRTVALATIAALIALLVPSLAASAVAADEFGVGEVLDFEVEPSPSWLSGVGPAQDLVGTTAHAMVAEEFGFEADQSVKDYSRFVTGDRYDATTVGTPVRRVVADVVSRKSAVDFSAGDADVVAVTTDASGDNRLEINGPVGEGLPRVSVTDISDDEIRGLAITTSHVSSGNNTNTVVVAHPDRIELRRAETANSVADQTYNARGLTLALDEIHDVYSRPWWQHYRHERDLPSDVFMIAGSRLGNMELLYVRVVNTSIEILGRFVVTSSTSPLPDFEHMQVRYDIWFDDAAKRRNSLGETPGTQQDLHVVAGFTSPDHAGQRVVRFTVTLRPERGSDTVLVGDLYADQPVEVDLASASPIDSDADSSAYASTPEQDTTVRTWSCAEAPEGRPAVAIEVFDEVGFFLDNIHGHRNGSYTTGVACAGVDGVQLVTKMARIEHVISRDRFNTDHGGEFAFLDEDASPLLSRHNPFRDGLLDAFTGLDVQVEFPCTGRLLYHPLAGSAGTVPSCRHTGPAHENSNGVIDAAGQTERIIEEASYASAHVLLARTAVPLLPEKSALDERVVVTRSFAPPKTPHDCTPSECSDDAPRLVAAYDQVVASQAPSVPNALRVPAMAPMPGDPYTMKLRIDDTYVEETDPSVLALLVAPPTVAGARQDVLDPTFANSTGSGQTVTDSTTHTASVFAGIDIEDPTGAFGAEVDTALAASFGEEFSTGRTITLSDIYKGEPDEHVVVYQTKTVRVFEATVLDDSTGRVAGETIPIFVPLGVTNRATTYPDFSARFFRPDPNRPDPTATPGVSTFQQALDDALPEVGDPSSYLAGGPGDQAEGSPIDAYCVGKPGPQGGFDPGDGEPDTPSIKETNPFLPADADEVSNGPDILIGAGRSVGADDSASVITGSEVQIQDTQAASRIVDLSVSRAVEAKAGYATFGYAYEFGWGKNTTNTLSSGVTFSAGVGSIPNPALANETYSWRAALCKHRLSGNLGQQDVYVFNYLVWDYEGSGGIEDAGPITLQRPVSSQRVSTDPTLRWVQPEGTVESYTVEIEAIGSFQSFTVNDVFASADTTEAKAQPDQRIIKVSELDLPRELLENQLYRWRTTSIDFFGDHVASEWEFFVTDGPAEDLTLSVSDPSPTVGEQVTLRADHEPTDGVTYEFDLGDGRMIPSDSKSIVAAYPASGFYAATVTATNSYGSATASTQIAVGPEANDDSYETTEDHTLAVGRSDGVLANDPGGQIAATTIDPAHGVVDLEANGAFRYDPDADFCGTDSFTYSVTGGPATESATATIEVECVNDAPVARDLSYSTDEDTSLSMSTPGLLEGATDVDSVPTLSFATNSLNATVAAADDGSFTYTPDPDFCGPDHFFYTATDGKLSDTARVDVDVACVNDAPVAGEVSFEAVEDTELSVDGPGVLAETTDVDSVPTVVSATDPFRGSVTVAPDGSLTYLPDPDACGEDSFEFTVSDGELEDVGTAIVDVACVNDAPVVGEVSFEAVEDTELSVDGPGVLAETTDVDSVPTVVSATDPFRGSVTVAPDGSLTYLPDPDACGEDSFDFTVSDDEYTDTATATIVVECVNDAPTVVDHDVTTDQPNALTVAAPGVLEGAHDIEGDPLTARLAAGPSGGTVEIGDDGSFTYTPDPDFYGDDSFDFLVEDGNGGTARGMVHVVVRGATRTSTDPMQSSGALRAVLAASDGAPIEGEVVRFISNGRRLCSATTDAAGRARCVVPGNMRLGAMVYGHHARFLGSDSWQPSSDSAWGPFGFF